MSHKTKYRLTIDKIFIVLAIYIRRIKTFVYTVIFVYSVAILFITIKKQKQFR